MKAYNYLAACILALGLMACQRETVPGTEGMDLPEGTLVEVTFPVAFPEPVKAPTRAQMGEGPLETEPFELYLCLYNTVGDGYVQNWIHSTQVDLIKSGGYITGGTYKAYLPLTDEGRIVHVIANPPVDDPEDLPIDYMDYVMENLVDADGECTYWQQVVLSNIKGRVDTQGTIYADPTSVKPLTDGVNLVRNYAKVIVRTELPTLEDGVTENPDYEHFQLLSWTLINVPKKGYIAPYTGDKNNRFPSGYLNVSPTGTGLYNTLKDTDNYLGYMPKDESGIIDNAFPGEPADVRELYVGNGDALYMYERPLPTSTEPQTAILAQIQFDEEYDPGDREDHTYWYKVEVLNDQGNYIPFYRDIVYRVKLSGLEAAGQDTAEGAFLDTYFGNISASLETAGLNELSNGQSLIHVDLMDYTYLTGGRTVILGKTGAEDPTPAQYYYIPYLTTCDQYWQTTTGVCTITVDVLADEGYDAAIVDGSLTVTEGGVIAFELAETGARVKKSIIRVAGKTGNPNEPGKTIYRDIVINLMDTQDFIHGTDVTRITNEPTVNGSLNPVDIEIFLPEDLGSSVFPIQVRIEAANNSLTATSVDLPLAIGESVFHPGKNTYYFIRTIKYSEYCKLNPQTKKYEYKYNFPVKLYTSKTGDNSTQIDIRDLAGNFKPTVLTLE